jgi:hypothetical protein
MKHDLIAAAVGFLGNFRGAGMIREHGERQGIVKRKNGIDGPGIACDIVKKDSQARSRNDRARRRRGGPSCRRALRVEQGLHAGFDSTAAGQGKRERCQSKAEHANGVAPKSRELGFHKRI